MYKNNNIENGCINNCIVIDVAQRQINSPNLKELLDDIIPKYISH